MEEEIPIVIDLSSFSVNSITVLDLSNEGNSSDVSLLATTGNIGYMTEMNGFLYASEFNKNTIARISLDGEVEHVAGTGAQSQTDGNLLEATFFNPNGIVGDAENNILYISDWGSPRLSKIQL